MTITTIANICLLAAALLGLCAMLRWDLQNLQQNDYSNSRYNAWLRESSDLTSPKRLTVIAVLIASFTTMAQMSWMVVMLLAIILACMAVAMLLKRHEKPLKFDSRVARRFITAMILALMMIVGTYYLGKHLNKADVLRPTSMLAMMILAVSPLLTMTANAIFRPLEKNRTNGQNEAENNH